MPLGPRHHDPRCNQLVSVDALPVPDNRRVGVGERTWEVVSGDPIEGTLDGVEAVPVNQMYVHHL